MRQRTQYQCQSCGSLSPKWAGQCADCGLWNTLTEVVVQSSGSPAAARATDAVPAVTTLDEIDLAAELRHVTGNAEMDRVLGGGLVSGSAVLLGGDPGIGKSTLLLQLLGGLAQRMQSTSLYVSGEESLRQVALRAQRLAVAAPGLKLLAETSVERIVEAARRERPRVLVVDSIQTVYSEALASAAGSVSQVRDCAARLVSYAKSTQTSLFLVGHVTKDGTLAGPRVLEHMVDTVLHFEGESGGRYRVVRALKNRFGAVNELGVFAMTDRGLREVDNPSALFLSRHDGEVPGSVVLVTREGTRPLLVEVQALVDESLSGAARRVTVGIDQNRLAMLLAILHRHAGVTSAGQDVFVNVVGGVRLQETGADLAVLLAVVSSLRDRAVPRDLVVFGELGLAGEVRAVQGGPERLHEAEKHGFRRAIVPRANAPKRGVGDLELIPVARLEEVLAVLRE